MLISMHTSRYCSQIRPDALMRICCPSPLQSDVEMTDTASQQGQTCFSGFLFGPAVIAYTNVPGRAPLDNRSRRSSSKRHMRRRCGPLF